MYPSEPQPTQFDWNWFDSKNQPQSYRGAFNVIITDSGALVFFDSVTVDLVIAPGDWHDVTREEFDPDA